jgi:hypothetical protein
MRFYNWIGRENSPGLSRKPFEEEIKDATCFLAFEERLDFKEIEPEYFWDPGSLQIAVPCAAIIPQGHVVGTVFRPTFLIDFCCMPKPGIRGLFRETGLDRRLLLSIKLRRIESISIS